MERIKSLRKVIILLAAIFIIELILLAVMLSPATTIIWTTIGTIAIAGIYMIVLSWKLLKELEEKDKK